MEYDEFKRVLSLFTDTQNDMIVSKGEFVIQVRGNTIAGKLSQNSESGLLVQENGIELTARRWIIERLAQIPLLAERIISYTNREEHFVTPTGTILDSILSDPKEATHNVENIPEVIIKTLSSSTVGMTRVVYLTSDAGEGKTTLINEIAYQQALKYRSRESDWIILPISLMGRTFLRFDDVFVGALMNLYRFPMLYFDSLIELVRMGVIVPALDGFEEVFVESEGEALSAVGNLMSNLKSAGRILIASRKAFFEFKSFASQAKLIDALSNYDADFSHISIDKWKKPQFIDYATKRNIVSPSQLYDDLSQRLHDENHALLTRAFLVKSMLTFLIEKGDDVNSAISELVGTGRPIFSTFVRSIVEREAQYKWIDKSGEPLMPLLSVDEHFQLLAYIAEEMWIQNADLLSGSMLDGVAELFSDSLKLGASKTRQVKERIKQHALIIPYGNNGNQFSFDHEEFKNYFLGHAVVKYAIDKNWIGVKGLLQRRQMPELSYNTISTEIQQQMGDRLQSFIQEMKILADNDIGLNYLKENIGSIIIRILDKKQYATLILKDLLFSENALENRFLNNLIFQQCMFQPTALHGSNINNCVFDNCRFDTLDITDDCKFQNVDMDSSQINHLIIKGHSLYEPNRIKKELVSLSLMSVSESEQIQLQITQSSEPDEEIINIEKVIRAFSRATALNDDVIKLKTGYYGNKMIDDVLPDLMRNGIIHEMPHSGSGIKKRYKLAKQMQEIQKAFSECGGNYKKFLELLNK